MVAPIPLLPNLSLIIYVSSQFWLKCLLSLTGNSNLGWVNVFCPITWLSSGYTFWLYINITSFWVRALLNIYRSFNLPINLSYSSHWPWPTRPEFLAMKGILFIDVSDASSLPLIYILAVVLLLLKVTTTWFQVSSDTGVWDLISSKVWAPNVSIYLRPIISLVEPLLFWKNSNLILSLCCWSIWLSVTDDKSKIVWFLVKSVGFIHNDIENSFVVLLEEEDCDINTGEPTNG